ncbi:MAG: NACHT domain-containing protein, partial [Bacteroidota bacterium]|nr:NACHT domain-containing protein [Bacteroidota bacterium]
MFVSAENPVNVSDDNISNVYDTSFITVSVDNISYIKDEFLACLSLYLEKDQQIIKKFSDELFETLLESCEIALMEATDKGQLSAHEAMSSLRYSMLTNELATIKKNLSFLNSEKKLSIQEILDFEKRYLQQVRTRHGYVIPPYYGVVKKVPINDIFIDPSFISLSSKNVFNMQDFLSGSYRAVILGNPGAGKSTFALKFCHDLATNYDNRILLGRQVIPILVTLRHYVVHKKENKSSIREFVEMTSNCDYQIKPPAGVFEYMFLNGHTVVIFDGLDELIETRHRQEISSDIESFCTLYPSVPVIVTSREVGYYEAPLNKSFEIFRLNPFNESQVREYTDKWFSIDEDLTPEIQRQKTISFLRESQI